MKFCFFGGNISVAIKGNTPGGGELQIFLLAKALALKGHEVIVVDPFLTESYVTEEGIKVLHVPAWNKGIKGFRLFSHRIPGLYRLFKQQNADYYYVRMRSYFHLLSYLAAKKKDSKFIMGIANDLDICGLRKQFSIEYKSKFNFRQFFTYDLPSNGIFKYLLKRADYITLQHTGQQPAFSIKGKAAVFANIFDYGKLPDSKNSSGDYFISVGSLSIQKGTGSLYQLIKMIDKKNKIIIVGEPRDKKAKEIYRELELMSNVILKGRLSHPETIQLIANARALICTSDCEGFPNVFLEAWAPGVPVISLSVNPGEVITRYDLGIYCGGDLKRMKECMEQNETARIDKNKLISYTREFHDFSTSGDRFLKILENGG